MGSGLDEYSWLVGSLELRAGALTDSVWYKVKSQESRLQSSVCERLNREFSHSHTL